MKTWFIVRLAVLAAATLAGGLLLARQDGRAQAAVASGSSRFCGEQRLFGYIRSLTKSGSTYRLRFDPAFFLSGATANDAAQRDGVIPKGQPVPNDNDVVNESRRTYLYTVTPATRVRVLLKGGDITGGSPIGVAALADFVHGKHLGRLFEDFRTGFWLGVHVDRACSLTQQYRP